MRLLAIRQTFEGCPPAILRVAGFPESVTHVTEGKTYEAFAVAVWEGVPFVQIINDLEFVTWLPLWLFKLEDNVIPEDWIINCFESNVSMVLGPSFLAESAAAYDAMVNEEVLATTKFWKRVRERKAKKIEDEAEQ